MTESKSGGTAFAENEPEGEWFAFFGSHLDETGKVIYEDAKPGAGRVRIRSLTPLFESRQAKRKRKYEWVLNPSTRAMERVGYFEEPTPEESKVEAEDTWDYAITEIEGFSINEKPIQATREGKLRLMRIPEFNRFIARCLVMLSESNVKQAEGREKN